VGRDGAATTLAAWLVAWVVVVVISGVLVTLMANLVMPVLGEIVARWTAGDARPNRR
jgi:antibiotic biosynthesis monooxygenase (ABM) superfamily enzyme